MDHWSDKIDELVYELEYSIREDIRTEYEEEIKRLKDELESLKDFRESKLEYDRKVSNYEYQIKNIKATADREAAQKRVSELLKNITKPAWKITGRYDYVREKCDKCDEQRMIHFKSPSGKDFKEECECAEHKYFYLPEEVRCVEFHTRDKEVSEIGMCTFIEVSPETNYPYSSSGVWERAEYGGNYAHILYKNESFEKIKTCYNWFYFLDKDKCEEFCKQLNEEKNSK